ncbi:MAG: helix-turn-helix transcriptional regulator [Rhodobacteraceae bacterium]|nr:helix-turn-helix transcriptional regulator [Paracoccaceae bacterium]
MMPMVHCAELNTKIRSQRLARGPSLDDGLEGYRLCHGNTIIASSSIRQLRNTSIAAPFLQGKIGNMKAAAAKPSVEDMSPTAIGERLALIRRAFGFGKAEFADLLEIERPAWSRFENGKRAIPYEQASKIVRRFGVSLDFIILGRVAGMEFEVIERLRQAGFE